MIHFGDSERHILSDLSSLPEKPLLEENISRFDIATSMKFWDDLFDNLHTFADTSIIEGLDAINKLIEQFTGFSDAETRELDKQVFSEVDILAVKAETSNTLDGKNLEEISTLAPCFTDPGWQSANLEQRMLYVGDLVESICKILKIHNTPPILFFDEPDTGNYGGYDLVENRIEINIAYMNDPKDVVDTISHELWHTHQKECASDSNNERGILYSYNFRNYVSPADNYKLYSSQLVEVEARVFACEFSRRFFK